MELKKLSTIQKRNNLNDVYVDDTTGPGNGRHSYSIVPQGLEPQIHPEFLAAAYQHIHFQEGARKEPDSIHGILDSDLLEIVRHRLQCFQAGAFSTRENAIALTHVEEALMWMNKRAEDRAERNVLGTMEK